MQLRVPHKLTANGLEVIFLHFWISFRKSSGVGWVNPVMIPSPPAFDTADASSAYPTHIMPPCTTGTVLEVSLLQYHLSGEFVHARRDVPLIPRARVNAVSNDMMEEAVLCDLRALLLRLL